MLEERFKDRQEWPKLGFSENMTLGAGSRDVRPGERRLEGQVRALKDRVRVLVFSLRAVWRATGE